MQNTNDLITIDDFMANALFLFKTCAIIPYHGYTFKKPSIILNIFFIFLAVNAFIQFIVEVTYLVQYFPELAVVDTTESISHIEFGILCCTKVLVIFHYNNLISAIVLELKIMFPKSMYEQNECNVKKYYRIVIKTSKYWTSFFFTAHMGFSLVPISASLFEFFTTGKFPYLTMIRGWYPFSYKTPILYSLVYFHQFWGVYWIGAIILCTDLLLGATLMQICMHFDIMAREILRIKENEGSLQNIRHIARYHSIVSRLSADLSRIFSIIFLVHMIIGACTICFIAMQITSAEARVHAANYILTFLFLSAQVYQISYFGSKLIDASDDFTAAVYNHNWYSQSLEYKKAIVFILLGCAKQSNLSVGGFTILSVRTFGQVFQYSYKIFAVLNSI